MTNTNQTLGRPILVGLASVVVFAAGQFLLSMTSSSTKQAVPGPARPSSIKPATIYDGRTSTDLLTIALDQLELMTDDTPVVLRELADRCAEHDYPDIAEALGNRMFLSI